MQILFEYKPHSRVRFESNPLEMYKVEVMRYWFMSENKHLSDEDWQAVAVALSAFPNLIAAWVFGSAQDGFVRLGGDVDIAVLWRERPSLDDLLTLRIVIQDALQIDAIDLVTLNDASPILRFAAISGRAIFCRDAGQRAIFASLTAREYEDEMAMTLRALAGNW